METDLLLILKMKQGREDAFDSFVRKYYGAILKYCYYHCSERSCAEDLTQETFLKFFQHLQDYQHMGKLKNYLYTIARNLCISHALRRREESLETKPVPDRDPREDLEEQLFLEAAVQKLSPEFREVVFLHYFQDLTVAQTASVLGIGASLVKYRLKRARELLRKELEDGSP